MGRKRLGEGGMGGRKGHGVVRVGSKEARMFFFEKKNQKTFTL
jgi:hypothetical protein